MPPFFPLLSLLPFVLVFFVCSSAFLCLFFPFSFPLWLLFFVCLSVILNCPPSFLCIICFPLFVVCFSLCSLSFFCFFSFRLFTFPPLVCLIVTSLFSASTVLLRSSSASLFFPLFSLRPPITPLHRPPFVYSFSIIFLLCFSLTCLYRLLFLLFFHIFSASPLFFLLGFLILCLLLWFLGSFRPPLRRLPHVSLPCFLFFLLIWFVCPPLPSPSIFQFK